MNKIHTKKHIINSMFPFAICATLYHKERIQSTLLRNCYKYIQGRFVFNIVFKKIMLQEVWTKLSVLQQISHSLIALPQHNATLVLTWLHIPLAHIRNYSCMVLVKYCNQYNSSSHRFFNIVTLTLRPICSRCFLIYGRKYETRQPKRTFGAD